MSLVLPVTITRSEPLVCRESLRSATASNNPSSCSLDQPTYRKTNKKSSWISFLQCWQSHHHGSQVFVSGERNCATTLKLVTTRHCLTIAEILLHFLYVHGIVQQHWSLSQGIAYYPLQKSFSIFSISWNCATTLKIVTRYCLLPIAEILLPFLNFLELFKKIEARHMTLPTHCRNPAPFSQFLEILQRILKVVTRYHLLPIAEILLHFLNFLASFTLSAIKEFRVLLLTCTNLWIKDEEREHLLIFSCCSQARMIIYAQVMLEPHNCHCLPTASCSSCCSCWWWCQAMCRAIFSGGVTPDCGDEQPCSSKSVPFLRHSSTVDTWNTLEVEEATTSRRKLLLWRDGSEGEEA